MLSLILSLRVLGDSWILLLVAGALGDVRTSSLLVPGLRSRLGADRCRGVGWLQLGCDANVMMMRPTVALAIPLECRIGAPSDRALSRPSLAMERRGADNCG